MAQKLFVGGLPFSTSTERLRELFAQGEGVESAITVVGVVDGSATPVRAVGPAVTRLPHDDHPGHEEAGVNVMAFATPARPDWRWRIVDYSAQIIEESFDGFPRTIAAAVAKGTERRALMIRVDTAQPVRVPRWASRAAR